MSRPGTSSRLLGWLLLCGMALPLPAEVYQWTDANGQTHFSDRPPTSGASAVDLPAPPAAPATTPAERLEQQQKLLRAFDEERRQARDAREQAKQDKAERQRKCNIARDRLRSLESSSAIYNLDANGERVYMDHSLRDGYIAERRQAVEEFCGKQ